MVVYYAAGLHPCVGDGGAYEFEATFFEGCGDLFGEWGFGWDLAGGLEMIVDRFAAARVHIQVEKSSPLASMD